MRSALREKYACGTSSPRNVIATVANAKAARPLSTESESSVSSTLVATAPHTIVDKVRLDSRRISRTLMASASPALAAISSRSRLRLKTARLSPANMPDWAMHSTMPSQVSAVVVDVAVIKDERVTPGSGSITAPWRIVLRGTLRGFKRCRTPTQSVGYLRPPAAASLDGCAGPLLSLQAP